MTKFDLVGDCFVLELTEKDVSGALSVRLPPTCEPSGDVVPAMDGSCWLALTRGQIALQIFPDHAWLYVANIQIGISMDEARSLWKKLGAVISFNAGMARLAKASRSNTAKEVATC